MMFPEDSSDDDNASLHVEICATLLTDKPPKLPLREELPSLGFEIIYNGKGVGEKASRYEAKKAIEHFRRSEQVKELTKRRIFPKSAKKIRDKLLERRLIEQELKMPHAFSYESYEHQLYDDVATASSSSRASSSGSPMESRIRQRKLVRGRRLFGMFRRSKSADDDVLPTSIRIVKDERTLDEVLSLAAFDDFLGTQDDIGIFPQRSKGGNSARETVESTTVLSGGTSAVGSLASGRGTDGTPKQMEIQFISSPFTEKYLPGLKTVQESDGDMTKQMGLDESVADAFANVETSVSGNEDVGIDAVVEVFGQLDSTSSLYDGLPILQKQDNITAGGETSGVGDAFVDVPDTLYDAVVMVPMEAGTLQTAAMCSPVPEFGFPDVCTADESKLVAPPTLKPGGWLHATLNCVLSKGAAAAKTLNSAGTSSIQIDTESAEMSDLVQLAKRFGTANELSDVLVSPESSIDTVKQIVSSSKSLLRLRGDGDGRLPLHVICSRRLPDRASIETSMLTQVLVLDIESYKQLVELVLSPHVAACMELDKSGDLPIHLLARNLMQWEAMWYERVYTQASKEEDPNGKTSTDISKLYRVMSETVELVLSPISASSGLCKAPGSIGSILPLHVAAIFTSSVPTLRKILEAYPEASKQQCELEQLRTFVPDKSKPLELHEGLSTDFPKWEVEKHDESNSEISWSQEPNAIFAPEDSIRRSDLLLAYNPEVEPYRFEKTRIRRLEARISFEVKNVMEGKTTKMSAAAERLWIWVCTFKEDKSMRPTYVKSVQRIVEDLPHRAILHLASVKVNETTSVLDSASPQCNKILRDRLGENTWSVGSTAEVFEGYLPSQLNKSWRKGMTLLCRLIFNIKEESFPTSFIVLPYQLTRTSEGKIKIASEKAAPVAMKFAESLLLLTDPRSILHFLDMKATKHYDQSMYENGADETARYQTYSKIRELEATFLGLYGYEDAYLYLIDEVNGVPVVPSSQSAYPLIIKEPGSMVRKLLPMMLMGMLMMRGEKAMSVLINVLLDVCVTKIASNWVDAAKDLLAELDDDGMQQVERSLNIKKLKADLHDFLRSPTSKLRYSDKPRNGDSEWTVELSILKMLMQTGDKSLAFCGLKKCYIKGRGVVWYHEDVPPLPLDIEFPEIAWSSAMTDSQQQGVESKSSDEQREDSVTIDSDDRAVKLKDVRRRFDALKRGERSNFVPGLDELSRKHDELTKQFGYMLQKDDDSAEISIHRLDKLEKELVPLKTATTVDYDSSNSVDSLRFPQPQHDSSDDDTRRLQAKRHNLRYSDDSETSDDELLRRSKLLLQRSSSFEQQQNPNDEKYESSKNADDYYRSRERHSLLFNELAFDPPDSKLPLNAASPPKPLGHASSVVLADIMAQLDASSLQQDDGDVIRLKVQLAQEAKKLESIGRRVGVMERQELLLEERQKEQKSKLLVSTASECEAMDANLAKARRLLVRLCSLEDRLLFNQIELQHIKLEAHSLQLEIDELSDPTALTSVLQENGRPAARVRFSEHESIAGGSSSSAPLTEIQLLADDLSRTSSYMGVPTFGEHDQYHYRTGRMAF